MSMKLDDKTLDDIAILIKKYCQKQKDVIQEYCTDIRWLEDYWDGSNFEDLLNDVEKLTNETKKAMIGIDGRYNPYYRKKAEMIRNRPAFSGGVVSGGRSSNSSSSASSSSGHKTFFDKVFQGYNKEIVRKIYTYLRKINFYKPNEKICFYDPNGKSKRGLYKNIMAIDINSPTFHQDMLSLTGQHIFFQIQHNQQMQLIRCLGVELENKALLNELAYNDLTKQIKTGTGIETKYLTFPSDDVRTAFNFFTKAFQSTVSNNNDEIDKYKKYYSNSYGNFVEILHNLTDFK